MHTFSIGGIIWFQWVDGGPYPGTRGLARGRATRTRSTEAFIPLKVESASGRCFHCSLAKRFELQLQVIRN